MCELITVFMIGHKYNFKSLKLIKTSSSLCDQSVVKLVDGGFFFQVSLGPLDCIRVISVYILIDCYLNAVVVFI